MLGPCAGRAAGGQEPVTDRIGRRGARQGGRLQALRGKGFRGIRANGCPSAGRDGGPASTEEGRIGGRPQNHRERARLGRWPVAGQRYQLGSPARAELVEAAVEEIEALEAFAEDNRAADDELRGFVKAATERLTEMSAEQKKLKDDLAVAVRVLNTLRS